jgi:hypothetical protein
MARSFCRRANSTQTQGVGAGETNLRETHRGPVGAVRAAVEGAEKRDRKEEGRVQKMGAMRARSRRAVLGSEAANCGRVEARRAAEVEVRDGAWGRARPHIAT